jgi:hypothetical protein
MWGSSQTVTIPDVSDGTRFQTSQQLARIAYARPETWSFFLACELLQAPEPAVPNLLVIVQFELMIGIGRGMIQLNATENGQNNGFARMVWKFGAAPILPAQTKWTTTVRTPPLDEGVTDPVGEEVTHFPAQDIQINVKAVAVTSGGVVGPDPRTLLNCHAYFSPVNHIRPEWFNVDNPEKQFRAGETGGM